MQNKEKKKKTKFNGLNKEEEKTTNMHMLVLLIIK
jgi:hypothetical protein